MSYLKVHPNTKLALDKIGMGINEAIEYAAGHISNAYQCHLTMALISRVRLEYDAVLRSLGMPTSFDNTMKALYGDDFGED